jgi:hypothetical protein
LSAPTPLRRRSERSAAQYRSFGFRDGLAASLAHPGGNLTGVDFNDYEVWGKRLQILKEAVPSASKVAFLLLRGTWDLEDLGFVPRGEAGPFTAERNTAPGGKLPLNTNGGGLSYMHSGMYRMYALQESVLQMRGTAPAQIPGAKISVCHGIGGMFAASGTIIMSNEPP